MAGKAKIQQSKVTIKIPRPLYVKIGRVIEDGGYDSVTDFVVYVLRDLVASHEIHNGAADQQTGEIQEVKQRLRALGYL
ncbi:MAG: hypothetical protein JW810_09835 [Sedimentisphaerales bacterium]|nr:hypothetical protein [Sedimentisphaerales bacterium]